MENMQKVIAVLVQSGKAGGADWSSPIALDVAIVARSILIGPCRKTNWLKNCIS
jgi:hypothetical protein